MAKKETKNKKVASKKAKPTVVNEEKNEELVKVYVLKGKKSNDEFENIDLAEENQEPSQEVLEEILETAGEIVEIKEPEYEPTAEDIEKTIEPLNEEPVVEDAVEEVKKITKKVDRTFGYLWNGQAIDF